MPSSPASVTTTKLYSVSGRSPSVFGVRVSGVSASASSVCSAAPVYSGPRPRGIVRDEQHGARLGALQREKSLVVGCEIVAGCERDGDAIRSFGEIERRERRLRAALRRNLDGLLVDRAAVELEAHGPLFRLRREAAHAGRKLAGERRAAEAVERPVRRLAAQRRRGSRPPPRRRGASSPNRVGKLLCCTSVTRSTTTGSSAPRSTPSIERMSWP